MLVYILYVISPVAIAFIQNATPEHSVNKDKNTKLRYLLICGIIMFLMIGLRSQYNGSMDSSRYYAAWENIRGNSLSEMEEYVESSRMEPVFLYTVWVLTRVFFPAQLIFVFSGILFTISVCRFIYKNCEDVVLGMTMYNALGLFSFMIQGMRQSIAMSICLFAIEMCKERKFWKFVALVLLASCYHRSALFFIMLYPYYGLKLNIKTFGVMVVSCVALFISSNLLVMIGNDVVQADYGATVDGGGLVATLVYILIVFAAVLLSGEKKQNISFSFFIIVTVFGMILYIMRYFGAQIMERVSLYFMFGQLIALPGTLRTFDRGWRQWTTIGVILLCVLLCVYRQAGSDLIPYEFFFNETPAGIEAVAIGEV